ncbi:electron transport complex subunit RsxE [Fonticella tunisiensis]|uniref:Ion-translocating oxidoreductase complex subunit E n=1 Tax=Fonticella tunisiensis TaxID=1096341 RepID=A0A4R7KR26_9CLOT|nr:electron transport complex subunit E [Fonticella tunisiensis]TDT61134.1 electron transport complex protein RnfE [Fonticella tunisiensis]
MNRAAERLYNGIVKENTIFVQVLAMCPTLAVTTSAENGLGMGLATTGVLIFSNLLISLLRKVIPDKIRIPAYIVIIASLVTLVEFILKGFVPGLYQALGIFIPLIVVNCVILGRAEAYASKNPVYPSIFDGLGIGLGFALALLLLGSVREILGAGKLFGVQVMPSSYQPALIMVLAPGAFFALGIIMGLFNYRKMKVADRKNRIVKKSANHCTIEQ